MSNQYNNAKPPSGMKKDTKYVQEKIKIDLSFIGATDPKIKQEQNAKILQKIDEDWTKTQEWWRTYRNIYCQSQTFKRTA
jgi:hypothetical protein